MGAALTKEDLERAYPGWSIWRSVANGRPRSWWATRRRLLTQTELWQGLCHTLAADSAAELRRALAEQDEHEAALTGAAQATGRPVHPFRRDRPGEGTT